MKYSILIFFDTHFSHIKFTALIFYHKSTYFGIASINKKKPCQSRAHNLSIYQIARNIFCDTGFSPFAFSSSFLAISKSSIRFSSSAASSSPRCVYVFSVTPISLCPIKYWSVFGFMPDFAMLLQ